MMSQRGSIALRAAVSALSMSVMVLFWWIAWRRGDRLMAVVFMSAAVIPLISWSVVVVRSRHVAPNRVAEPGVARAEDPATIERDPRARRESLVGLALAALAPLALIGGIALDIAGTPLAFLFGGLLAMAAFRGTGRSVAGYAQSSDTPPRMYTPWTRGYITHHAEVAGVTAQSARTVIWGAAALPIAFWILLLLHAVYVVLTRLPAALTSPPGQ